jgi:hypothetical protein
MAITLNGTTGITTPADTITGNATVGGTLTVNGVSNALGVPGTAGNVMASNGTAWVSTAPSGGAVTGQTIQYGSSTTPSGYLKCDGSTYNIAAYPTLAGVLGSLPASRAQYYNNLGGQYISYANSNVIITSGDATLWYSSNSGASFTQIGSSATPGFIRKVVWTGTNYVGPARRINACCGIDFNLGYVSSISSAVNFTSVGYGDQPANLIVYTGSRVVISYSATSSLYSTNNGVSWVAGGNIGFFAQTGAFGASIIVAAGGSTASTPVPVISTSPDGGTWTSRTVPAGMNGSYILYVSFTNSLFVAVDDRGNVCSSPDGITWTYKGNAGVYGNVSYLAATSTYYMSGRYSSDLINWFILPVSNGYGAFTTARMVTDNTRIYGLSGTAWNPLPYTTGTQFTVPDFGGNALGLGTWGAYNYIKT